MKIAELWSIISQLILYWTVASAAQMNRPPRFVAGGDLAQFSIPEDVDVGSTIYKLRGADPEESAIYFSISGEHFAVNKYTGDVTLTEKLDREINDTVEVIISITDEPTIDEEANTISLRRQIPIIDVNDNFPVFGSQQYSFSLSESTRVGTVVFSNITISDTDFGINSMVNLFCVQSLDCRSFAVQLKIMSEGYYTGTITLSKPLNYETQSSYALWLKAIDSNPKKPLSTTAKVIIYVEDIQDQPPIFYNTPYSISVRENTPPNERVLSINAKDGDVHDTRPIIFSIEQDVLNYFSVVSRDDGNASIITTSNAIDREDPIVMQMGGIYTFYVKATELINNEKNGDATEELVTIVILDQNDQLPKFNKPIFRLNISEDIAAGTPLPSFGMVVSDDDVGENAQFSLHLDFNDNQFSHSFSVEPSKVTGRTHVIVRVINNSALDYENGVREIKMYVIASVLDEKNLPMEATRSEVILNIMDANDNFPKFPKLNYVINVKENEDVDTRIADIEATDRDSGLFSQIMYSVGGFGMKKFDTDPRKGGLILVDKLNYEQQISYALTLEAKDGGNRAAAVNVFVNVIDVNDNAPVFEYSEYRRNIREGSISFQPQFFVKAVDADGSENNNVTYSVVSSNADAVTVDKFSGEMIMLKPASSQHTSRGQYELKILANDSGIPALSSQTVVFIRVGVPGNQRPVFKGTPYNITISETLAPNSLITTVKAIDPDGPNEAIEYKIVVGADNFYIKSRSGKIFLSENADLINEGKLPKKFNITVFAIDAGIPFRETAQATVAVNVQDINNEPPVFKKDQNYMSHISEEIPVGSVILEVQANDPDRDADIEYSLLKPFRISDRRGFPLKDVENYFDQLFEINSQTGEITLQRIIKNPLIQSIAMTVEARDKNAAVNIDSQVDRVEVTIFVEITDELKPVFLVGGRRRSDPVILHDMFEELPIGSTVLTVAAEDSAAMLPVNTFQAKALPRQLAMDPLGNVVLTERVDYETIPTKKLSFTVEAISRDFQKRSEAKVIINVIDINDHAPQFQYEHYRGSVEENAKRSITILVVKAVDGDLLSSPQGYGNITYSLTGEHAFLLDIDPVYGDIKVGQDAVIDREKQFVLNLVAVAVDTPFGGKNRRKSEVPIQIDVLDVNDNAPIFKEKEFSVVMLENTEEGASVLHVNAFDPDLGLAGQINYEIANVFDNYDLFRINSATGEMTVKKPLTGRGRTTPYSLTVRAQDNGQPTLFSDVLVNVLVGDVVSNDGVPTFIHPAEDEAAYIQEDVPVGSPVFQVVGNDPDDSNTPEGQIQYSFLRDSTDVDAFNIDSKTGLITTRVKLDREVKNKYSLIILIKDEGIVPQQATTVLRVYVNDTDDNIPLFQRAVDEKPFVINVKEELPVGSVIATVDAGDSDEERNAQIGYLITEGDDKNLFSMADESNHSGMIKIIERLDREKISHILLTVKCFKKRETPRFLHKKYNKTKFGIQLSSSQTKSKLKKDLSERQFYIKILDIDDHAPKFVEENITLGVRFNVPVDFLVLTLVAHDADAEAGPIIYNIENSTFTSSKFKSEVSASIIPFALNFTTGELRVNSSVMEFVDGYFTLNITARNSPSAHLTSNIIKIYIVRERSLLKFVFSKIPSEVKETLPQFKTELENALALSSVQLNMYDVEFNSKEDGSVDFSKTSSCFHIISNRLDPKEAELLLKNEYNERLQEIYEKYNVQSVQRCGKQIVNPRITWVQISLLTIAISIGITSLMSTCILCCSYSRSVSSKSHFAQNW